ncbi:hypothetical protein BGX23_011632 [Mortierella sp. AD031]|nr:hypothetical protein BGX23_011632 [Mortierella sp. AD031]
MARLYLYIKTSPPFSFLCTQYTPFYLQTPPAKPSADEVRDLAELEAFYRQLGKQKDLRYLQLQRTEHIETGAVAGRFYEREEAFPGILRLKDNDDGNPGYLDLLVELAKLDTIYGAIYPETDDGKMPKDSKEFGWILDHWPYYLQLLHDVVPEVSLSDLNPGVSSGIYSDTHLIINYLKTAPNLRTLRATNCLSGYYDSAAGWDETFLRMIAKHLPRLLILDLFQETSGLARPHVFKEFLETRSYEMESLSINLRIWGAHPEGNYDFRPYPPIWHEDDVVGDGSVNPTRLHLNLKCFRFDTTADRDATKTVLPPLLLTFLAGCPNLEILEGDLA